jgi:hypothetical protein
VNSSITEKTGAKAEAEPEVSAADTQADPAMATNCRQGNRMKCLKNTITAHAPIFRLVGIYLNETLTNDQLLASQFEVTSQGRPPLKSVFDLSDPAAKLFFAPLF